MNDDYDIILMSGGFDPPHIGHVRMIIDAASRGKEVIIGVNSDEWLMRKKGYVFMEWAERAELIQSIKGVSESVAFDDSDNTASDLIIKARKQFPDLKIAFANGGDRVSGNTPEMETCSNTNVDMLWEIGGEKIQSSSELVKKSKK